MPKTLAELRASSSTSLPERTYTICLSQKLIAQAELLANEEEAILTQVRPAPDGESRPPRRLAQPDDPRLLELREQLETLYEEMREHTGDLLVRAIGSGAWTLWRDENPARTDGRDNEGRPIVNRVDQVVAHGWCDAGALLADLRRYVVSYNGEPVDDEGWKFITSMAAAGDLKQLCTVIVEMQEGTGVRAPKASSKPSSTKGTSGPGSPSPAASGSPTAPSSDGSPQSDTSTTPPTGN